MILGAALSAAGGGASLVNNVLTFIKTAQKEQRDPRISEILARLKPDAVILAGQYVMQIQDLRQSLLNEGVDLEKTQRALLADTAWYHFTPKKLVTKFEANINAIETQISRFLDDMVAVAQCCGDQKLIVDSFVEAEETRTAIHRETDPEKTLKFILDSLEGRARGFHDALGAIKS